MKTSTYKLNSLLCFLGITMICVASCKKDDPSQPPSPPEPEVKIEVGMVYYSDGLIVSYNPDYKVPIVGIIGTEIHLAMAELRDHTRWGDSFDVTGAPVLATAEAAKAESTSGKEMFVRTMASAAAGKYRIVVGNWAAAFHPEGLDFQENYIPTVKEALAIYENREAINKTRVAMGLAPFNGRVWTINTASATTAWTVNLETGVVEAVDRSSQEQVLLIAFIPPPIPNLAFYKRDPVDPNWGRVPDPDPPFQPKLELELGTLVYADKDGIMVASEVRLDDPNLTYQGVALGDRFLGVILRTVDQQLAHGEPIVLGLDEDLADLVPTYNRYTPLQLQNMVYAKMQDSPAIKFARELGNGILEWALPTAPYFYYIQENYQVFNACFAKLGEPDLFMYSVSASAYWSNHTIGTNTCYWRNLENNGTGGFRTDARRAIKNIILIAPLPAGWNGE